MRKRNNVQRVWAGIENTSALTRAAPLNETVVLSYNEGDIFPGKTRLVRVLGSANVFVSNAVAGDMRVQLWLGLWLGETDTPGGTVNPVPGTIPDDENEGSWLWREYVPLLDPARPLSNDDFMMSWPINWMVRGGKGSLLSPGSQFRVISAAHPDIDSTTTVNVQLNLLPLFATT